jgi:Lactoylglutathione lyase and related lyases
MGVLRISHVNIRVLDMEASLHHYINVVGMKKCMRINKEMLLKVLG